MWPTPQEICQTERPPVTGSVCANMSKLHRATYRFLSYISLPISASYTVLGVGIIEVFLKEALSSRSSRSCFSRAPA